MSIRISYILVLNFIFLQLVSGQISVPGLCPEIHTIGFLDLNRYAGTWFEYAKFPNSFEDNLKCCEALYVNLGDNTLSIDDVGIDETTNVINNMRGTATLIAQGQLEVKFEDNIFYFPDYLILDTDYDNYAVVFGCSEITPDLHLEMLWILTRERHPAEEIVRRALQVVIDNGISESQLTDTDQIECPEENLTTSATTTTETELPTTFYYK